MLLPYTIAQPLLTNPVAPPPEPTDVAPLASDTFFGGAQPILVTVEGTAWLRRSWWVVYAQIEGKPLAIRVTAKADVARSGPTSPKGLADLKQGSTIQLSSRRISRCSTFAAIASSSLEVNAAKAGIADKMLGQNGAADI